ncbi:ABC transporter D family member 1 [Smittium culicis]|uniref:ABC transporter D family member 1 n=1 Tax=Smittium culicis TaxID=133412 RepID=A0A1R1Y6G8_9FUNG|nr:ABC transporter D family member 1 [Smittium culicis]
MSGHDSKKDSVPQSEASSNSLNANAAKNKHTSKTAGQNVLSSYAGLQSYQFNIKFGDVGKLYKVISIALSSKEKGVATEGMSLGIIPISILLFLGFIAGEFVAYFVGLVPSDFYLSLVGVDKKLFDKTMLKSAFLVLLSAVLVAVNNLFSGIVQAKSRLSLSSYTQNIYIKKHTLNKLVLEKKIDNPDQRITQDIDKLSASFMKVISQIFISPVLVVYYSVRTWKITGYIGPVSIYIFFVIGVILSRLLVPMISSKVFYQEKAEGYYRSAIYIPSFTARYFINLNI